MANTLQAFVYVIKVRRKKSEDSGEYYISEMQLVSGA